LEVLPNAVQFLIAFWTFERELPSPYTE